MALTPVGMQVLVALEELPMTSAGGIQLPENLARQSRERAEQGVVIAVGPGALNREGIALRPEVAVGDRVVVKRFLGTEFTLDGRRAAFVNGDPRADPHQCGILAVLA